MKRLAAVGSIAAAVTAIIGLGLGARIWRWEMFICLGAVIAWSLVAVLEKRANELNRITIGWQARVIRNQAELLGRIYTQDIDGRE